MTVIVTAASYYTLLIYLYNRLFKLVAFGKRHILYILLQISRTLGVG
jgi:hypothetical protein